MCTRRLIAIDPSLTCSGWALFAVADGQLLGVGKIRSVPTDFPFATRLRDLQDKINALFEQTNLSRNDVLICEAPTTMRDPRAAIKVEQVRSIFETVARVRAVQVPGRLNPRSVHYEVMGLKGRQLPRDQIKDAAIQTAGALFGASLERLGFASERANLKRHQDIVDALLIGSLALTRLRAAEVAGITLEEYFDREIQARSRNSQVRLLKRAAARVGS